MSLIVRSLLQSLPDAAGGEVNERLLDGRGLRLERVVSLGQTSPPGFWYDQDEDEWVMLLAGAAHLAIAGESTDRQLGPGDSVMLPAHCRHRVTWTDPDRPTVWLALFIDPVIAGRGK
jgi:cupin 2 domain-containing protein